MKKTTFLLAFTIFTSFLLATDQEEVTLTPQNKKLEKGDSQLLPASSFDPVDIQTRRQETKRFSRWALHTMSKRTKQNKVDSKAFIDVAAQMRMMNSDRWHLQTAPHFLTAGTLPFQRYSSRDTIQILLNGSISTLATPSDSLTITVVFSDSQTTAEIEFFLDEGDGMFDPETDFDLLTVLDIGEEVFIITDNEEEDENPDEGIWEITILLQSSDFLFLGMEGATLFVTATDGGGSASATLYTEGIESAFSISGEVNAADTLISNIIIAAFPAVAVDHPGNDGPDIIWTTLTDSAGNYTLHVPETDIPEGENWYVFAIDILGVTEGLFPSVFAEDVIVSGPMEGVNFSFVPPNAQISGFLTDPSEIPIAGIPVIAEAGPYGVESVTNESGMFDLWIMDYEQGWSLGPDEDSIYGDYLLPFWREIFVPAGETAYEDFVLFPLDSQVSGTLHLGESFAPQNVAVIAWSELGWNLMEISDSWDVPYDLGVSSLFDFYWVTVHHLDFQDEVIFMPEGYEAAPGDTDLDFTLVYSDASISGQILADGPDAPPVHWAWVQISNDSITVTRQVNHEGFFHLPAIGDMSYNLYAFAEGFEPFFDSLYIASGEELWIDIYLTPFEQFNAAIEGIVTDLEGAPIPGTIVTIWSWNFQFETETDEDGYFYHNVPPGFYEVEAHAEGFFPQTLDVAVEEGQTVFVEFSLVAIEGAIYGTVTDEFGNPVGGARVVADGQEYYDWQPHFEAWTNDAGEYYMPVVNNLYNLAVIHPGFWIEWVDSIEVTDSEVQVDFSLSTAPMEGAIEGHIELYGIDEEQWIYLQVWNDSYVGWMAVPPHGYYHIDVPNGVYNIFAIAEGYQPFYDEQVIEVNNNTVYFDITLYQEGIIPPYLFLIHDIPNDQGRQVRILWGPGDPGPFGVFTEFSIWRFVNESSEEYPIWDFIGTVPWHGEDIYSAVVPTLGDSTAYGIYWSIFMVTAHTEDPTIFFDSNPIIGYSIDNLAPHVPILMFTGSDEYGILSQWTGPVDEDFQYFNLYRRHTSDEFELRTTTTDTFFTDTEIEWSLGQYEAYITTVDFNGNESDTSNHQIFYWLDVNTADAILPDEYALHQNYPNPFNPTTTIRYDLPEQSSVSLVIYDILGREVQSWQWLQQEAGFKSVVWDGRDNQGNALSGGIYIYRISAGSPQETESLGEAGDFTRVRKMVLLK